MPQIHNIPLEEAYSKQPKTLLDQSVPSQFPRSEGKTWGEYCFWVQHPEETDQVWLVYGWRDANGNRPFHPNAAELQLYHDLFGHDVAWVQNYSDVALRADGTERRLPLYRFMFKMKNVLGLATAAAVFASTDAEVQFSVEWLKSIPYINLDHNIITQILTLWVQKSLITAQEANQLLE
jgi:hypothetical protein